MSKNYSEVENLGIGKIAAYIIVAWVGLSAVLYAINYMGETANVVDQEIRPTVIQEKYEWFQNTKASIDNLESIIGGQIESAKTKRNMMPDSKSDWTRTDKETYGRSIDDIMGVIAQRNNVIRDYNSAMSQWQMKFANLGTWPQGSKYSRDDFNQFPISYPEYSYGEELQALN